MTVLISAKNKHGQVDPEKVHIYASLIMKNEARNLPSSLNSLASYVDGFCIQDNGSTDSSIEDATRILDNIGKPYTIVTDKWYNYSENRNLSIRDTYKFAAKQLKEITGIDVTQPLTNDELEVITQHRVYFFFNDMDNTIHVCDDDTQVGTFDKKFMVESAYYIESRRGSASYKTQNLVCFDMLNSNSWKYVRGVHEYVTPGYPGFSTSMSEMQGCYIYYGHNGIRSRDPVRPYRDLVYLFEDSHSYGVNNKADGRSSFYIAQTLSEAGHSESAKKWYLEHGRNPCNFIQERYMSFLRAAYLSKTKDRLAILFEGYNLGLQRLEIAYELVRHFRVNEQHLVAWLIASPLYQVEVNKLELFIDTAITGYKFYDETSVAAYKVGEFEAAHYCAVKALTYPELPQDCAARLRNNLEFIKANL